MSMFCPNCGSSDQSPETYCRQCGKYAGIPLEQLRRPIRVNTYYFFANILFSTSTALVCIFLVASNWLCSFLGEPDCAFRVDPYPFLIFLGVMNAALLASTIVMMVRYSKLAIASSSAASRAAEAIPTTRLLNEDHHDGHIPAKFSDEPTKDLYKNFGR